MARIPTPISRIAPAWCALASQRRARREDGGLPASDGVLRYLCMSTMRAPDICVYPDSKKFGLFGGGAPGRKSEDRYLTSFVRSEPELQYFDGED